MEQRMRELVDMLNRYAYAYYVLDDPMVGDGQYDALYDELLNLEDNTGVVLPDSPTKRVGGQPLSAFVPHRHLGRLWSLDKCKTREEIIAWQQRVKRLLDQQGLHDPRYLLEYKIDGLTINLTYDGGRLVQAATRGNGIVGEGILPQVKTIPSIPLSIPYTGKFEVQGEGYMPLSAFIRYNEQEREPLKNARNAAAGALRNIDPRETAKRRLDAQFYQIGYWEGEPFQTAMDMRNFLKSNGFQITKLLGQFTDALKAFDAAMELDEPRRAEDYLTDGMVVKIDQMPLREALGTTTRFPRWAIAIKFEAEEVVTTLYDVIWEVGRTGKITPIALLEPVELAGATVSRATLNNPGDIERKNVKIGGGVWVRRSNDVIPEILGHADDKGNKIPIPTHCPFCDTELVMRGANLFCPNRKTCKPQRLYALVHFVSRDAMDIEGLSERTLIQAMDNLDVVTPDQLYDIPVDGWLSLEGFAQKRAKNIYAAVQNSKNRPLPNFLYALGIPNVGIRTARMLAQHYSSVAALESADEEELQSLKDVGPIVAQSIRSFFNDKDHSAVLKRLMDHGIHPETQRQEEREGVLAGETIVFTGTLQRMARREAQERARRHGARVVDNVTKDTTLLVAGDKAGSKLNKAKQLGLRILSEPEFFASIGEDQP